MEEALRHRSYVNEQNNTMMQDNERFEFLGDAVLNLVIGNILMLRHPEFNEGNLSMIRADLVNETQLAALARTFDIGKYVLLGKGEAQTNGREKDSILSDTYEAIVASVYLDGGFDAAYSMIEYHFSELFNSISTRVIKHYYKSSLQELVQTKNNLIPDYKIIKEDGPDHDKTFTVQLKVGKLSALGTGKSKKLAEQEAARKTLEIIEKKGLDSI